MRLLPSPDNRADFATLLSSNPAAGGNENPESTDEWLNTMLNALPWSGRVSPRTGERQSSPLQIGDFSPAFRTNVLKIVVLITDYEPGGFCDEGDNGARAAIYATQARTDCVRINAVQVGYDSTAAPIMLNYYHTSCGWYAEVPDDGTGIAEAAGRMFYVPGYCTCP